MKNVWWSRLLLSFIIVIVVSSCSQKVGVISKQQAEKMNEQLKGSEIDFDYFSTKAKVKYSNGIDGVVASLSFRMQDEEIIWASVSKFGKEAVRIKLENDSAYFLNKYPAADRFYSILSTQEYLNKSGFNLDFKSMQNLIFGIHPIPIENQDKVEVGDSAINIVQWRSKMRVETELDPNTSRIKSMETISNSQQDTLNTHFDEYKIVDNHFIPTKLKIRASMVKDGKRTISNSEINYSKTKFTSDSVSFSFKIPKGYEKR